MIILYAYLKDGNNTVACIPFRYNITDEDTIESREIILTIDPEVSTYETIRQQLLEILDKEKVEYGKLNTEFTDMPGVITIE